VVERDLAKVDVAGSTPVSRSRFVFVSILLSADGRWQGRGTQVVRERSAKPLRVGSIPTRASKSQSRKSPVNTAFRYGDDETWKDAIAGSICYAARGESVSWLRENHECRSGTLLIVPSVLRLNDLRLRLGLGEQLPRPRKL
jgi:hypothetical protein